MTIRSKRAILTFSLLLAGTMFVAAAVTFCWRAGVAHAAAMQAGAAIPGTADSDPPVDPVSLLSQFYDFIRSGKGTAAVGVGLMLLVWGIRNGLGAKVAWFKTGLGGYVLGFGLPAFLYFGTALASGNPFTAALVMNALGAGWVAAGGWEHLRDILTSMKKIPPVAGAVAAVFLLVMSVGATTSSGCGATMTKMTGSFVACEKTDLGQLVTGPDGVEKNLEKYMADLIALNAPSLESDLADLVVKVGLDAVECAYEAVVNAIGAPAAGSGSSVAATSQPLAPGAVRVGSWIDKQKTARAAAHK